MGRYVAKKNDTLAKIARRYGVDRKTLRKLNKDTKFGKAGNWKDIKGEELRLGKGVGQPQWKAELMQDPKYAAFQRQFAFDYDKIKDDFIRLRQRQGRDLARMEPVWQRQREDAFRNIDQSFGSRGLYRTGARVLGRGRADSSITQARQGYIDAQGEALEQARYDKHAALNQLKRNRSNERLATRERLALRDAETKYGYGA